LAAFARPDLPASPAADAVPAPRPDEYRPEGMDTAHTRYFHAPVAALPFRLESGASLPALTLAYETWGELNAAGDNAVLVFHALTGGAHAAAHAEDGGNGDADGGDGDAPAPWWDGMIGPGRAIDTRRDFVVCANILGGCYGSTGPLSRPPGRALPYRMAFPVVTVGDMVRAQALLLDALGVGRVRAVVGGSLGGMQALAWGAIFPERVGAVVAIGASGRFHAQGIAYNEVGRRAITADPKWQGGDYDPADPPRDGFAIARMVGMITYGCDEGMTSRFGRAAATRPSRHAAFGGKFDVEGYLHYQGDSLVRRFDANSYLYLTRTMDLFDIGSGFGGSAAALRRLTMPTLLVGISSDILFPAAHIRALADELRGLGQPTRYWELVSPDGHDAFLKEFDHFAPTIRRFLDDMR